MDQAFALSGRGEEQVRPQVQSQMGLLVMQVHRRLPKPRDMVMEDIYAAGRKFVEDNCLLKYLNTL